MTMLSSYPLRASHRPHLEFRDWRTLRDVADSKALPDYASDEEGKPILFCGRRIPVDRRMGGKTTPKVKRGKAKRAS